MQATARTVGQRSSWWPVKIFSLSAFRLAIRGLYLHFFLQSLCLFINFFDKWTAIAFDLAAWRLSLQQGSSSLLCLWLPLAAAILVVSNTTSPESRCMALQQLVWRCSLWDSSLELLIHSGGVHLNPGPDTGSNPVTSYGRRLVYISHSNVRGLLRR